MAGKALFQKSIRGEESSLAAELRRLEGLQPAAEKGSPESQSELADEYQELSEKATGAGDKKTQMAAEEAMIRFYRLSAERGYAEAQMRVGLSYLPCSLDGEPTAGVNEDLHEGLRWLEKAAAQEGEGSEAAYYAANVVKHLSLHKGSPTTTSTTMMAATSFIVFEGGCSVGTTTPDSQGLLCGVEPRGSGDWDCTITATPKIADSGDLQDAIKCKTLESVMYLLHCDHQYVCTTGDCPVMNSAEATEPCPCWQGKKNIPQNVFYSQTYDGNSGAVSWETDTHAFEMEYSTS